jgi:arylsulfatase A-like enzyme
VIARRILTAFVPILFLAACGSPDALPGGSSDQPDVILFSIDTLRPDHLGSYGYSRDTSPYMDELAAEGTRFQDAWSPSPWTLPSHATMLSGQMPMRHHAIEASHVIDEGSPALAAAFRAAGYKTMAAVSSIFVSSKYGLDRGFDGFEDFGLAAGELATGEEIDAQQVFAAALAWARDQSDGEPVFLFLHVYDVHYPYDAPSPYDEQFGPAAPRDQLSYENYFHYFRQPLSEEELRLQVEQYDEEIVYTDAMLRLFHETWTASRPNTILSIVSDHGEEFGERGSWGHAHTLMPEVLRVPWIVSGPDVKAQTIAARAGLEDLAPTLAGLARVSFAEGDGASFADEIRTGVVSPRQQIAASLASTSRFNTLKLRWHTPPYDLIVDLARGGYALYDLEQDPGANVNLIATQTDRAIQINAEMFRALGQPWLGRVTGRIETDGVIVVDGARQESPYALEAGRHFALFPLDATMSFHPVDGATSGPWQLLGGAMPPNDDPALAYEGELPQVAPAGLTAEQEERLRTLGYIH